MSHARSLPHVAAALLALGAVCHTAFLVLDRQGSAAVPDATNLELRRFFDGHYIPLPADPFTNCFDAVATTLPVGRPCSQAAPGHAYAGYAAEMIARPTESDAPWWMRDTDAARLQGQLREVLRCYAGVQGTLAQHLRPRVGELGWCNADAPPTPVPRDVAVTGVTPSAWRDDDVHTPRRAVEVELGTVPPEADHGLVWFKASAQGPATLGAIASVGSTAVLLAPRADAVSIDVGRVVTITGRPATPVLAFAHLSDAQIREPAAQLGGQSVSNTLDPLIPTFKHDYEQELFSGFFFEATVRTLAREREAALADADADSAGRDGLVDRCRAVAAGADACRLDDRVAAALGPWYRPPPEFAVHTGDAIDAGLQSEFDKFRARIDLLTIPWYAAVGNHDILGIGNLDLTPTGRSGKVDYACTPITRLLREYYLVAPVDNGAQGEAIAAHKRTAKRFFSFAPVALRQVCLDLNVNDDRLIGDDQDARGERRVGPRPPLRSTTLFAEAHCRGAPTQPAGGFDPRRCSRHLGPCDPRNSSCAVPYAGDSRLNGFDLTPRTDDGMIPGYYEFPVKEVVLGGRPRQLWAIVLNGAHDGGAFGALCPPETITNGMPCPQLDWLEARLAAHADDLVIVFAHHPIWGIEHPAHRQRLKAALFAHGNVLGYFAGHTHAPGLRVVEEDCDARNLTIARDPDGSQRTCGTSARRLWEVIAPSTIEFPQLARQVTLFDVPGSDLAYFEILTFEPHLTDDRGFVERANAGAKRDWCEGSSRCHQGEPPPPPQYLSYARLWIRIPK